MPPVDTDPIGPSDPATGESGLTQS
jgi:hypothetical protein